MTEFVKELLSSRRKFFSLPQAFYTDREIFDLDLEAIFYKRWIFAGAACEIPHPGDYITLSIGPTPIVVLRDQAGAIRAFFNTCRHRGSKICLAEKGAVKRLTCPYHQWTYDLTGRLVATGRMHEGFDRDCVQARREQHLHELVAEPLAERRADRPVQDDDAAVG